MPPHPWRRFAPLSFYAPGGVTPALGMAPIIFYFSLHPPDIFPGANRAPIHTTEYRKDDHAHPAQTQENQC